MAETTKLSVEKALEKLRSADAATSIIVASSSGDRVTMELQGLGAVSVTFA